MIGRAVGHLPNVSVEGFTGLLTTFCAERGIQAIVKGLRAVSDFDYELQMAQMNASLTDIETVFVPTRPEWSFLASSLVKEVAAFGGDVSGLVPDFVLGPLTDRLAARRAAADPQAPVGARPLPEGGEPATRGEVWEPAWGLPAHRSRRRDPGRSDSPVW